MQSDDGHKNFMSYVRQADATFRNGFESEEMKQIFLQNTFEEIRDEEVSLCVQKSSSFILENMIKEADLNIVLQFLETFVKENCWTRVACSQGGCHILEALSQRLVVMVKSTKELGEYKSRLSNLKKLIDVNEESIIAAMSDTYSTHAFRSYLQMLGGVYFEKKGSTRNAKDCITSKEIIPKGFLKMLQKICSCLCEIHPKKFVELICDVHASPCIACALRVASVRQLPKTLKRLSKKILMSCQTMGEEMNTLFILMKDKNGSHMIEALLEYGNTEITQTLHNIMTGDPTRYFELCAHPVANFVIQKLISSVSDSQQFETILDFTLEGLEDILADQNYGVVHRLAEQCVKFTTCQAKFFNKLLEAFHCESTETRKYVVTLLATLTAFEAFFKTSDVSENTTEVPDITSVEYHGSILLQTLIKFDNVGLLIKSLCEIPADHVVSLACSANGSHFIDAFFASSKVKLKKKRELLERLKNKLKTLACDKYGSRVLENIWAVSDINEKIMIAEDLSSQSDMLITDTFGKFILKKFNITKFQNRRTDWENFQKQNSNKRKFFANIVSETHHGKRQKKKV